MPVVGRQLKLKLKVQLSPTSKVLVVSVLKLLLKPAPVNAVLAVTVGQISVTPDTVYWPAVGVALLV
jgi:hypothetical protein